MSESAPVRRLDQLSDRTLGDFVVRELIGQGGFGAVYRAEQPLLEREAVIKVIARQQDASEASVARFLREARLASQLDHPYAAHIYAFGVEPDELQWIAMELVRGSTLAELCAAQGPMSLERFVPLLSSICEVVQTAHDQGIVHRDIKPENVMVLSRAGRYLPKLLDLGIAKAVGGEEVAPAALIGGGGNLGMTGAGGMLGSPRYMAPELWFAPQTAGPSVDQYALGALAYEVLTGEPAFPGDTFEEVAVAHAKKPPPRLPDEFPAALADVLAKAMGKRPGDRCESVLELADAMREASGIVIKPIEVPELDADLVTAVMASYPSPIVESVAAYTAAHNAHQARDAVRGMVATTVRYIGILALQCRSRLGPDGRHTTPRTAELLVELRRGALEDREWLELVSEICRPFARRPDSFPVPELVLWLFPGRDPGAVPDPLGELDGHSGVFDVTVGADDAILEAVASAAEPLESLLRAVAFVADYPLVVSRGDSVEVWTGVRSRVPVMRPRQHSGVADGHVLLESHGGAPVLSLWPLVQVAEPTPGAREDMFLFDGASRRGARLIVRPVGFELADDELWSWFSKELLEVSASADDGDDERPPYLGMSTFTAADAGNFFGREREIDAVANRLRGRALIAVVGPSGAGKSSFVHAGVAPALGEWNSISIRPGAHPMANLSARLSREGFDTGPLENGDSSALGEVLRAGAGELGNTLLVVDQFEEVFTMCRDDGERDRFIALVCRAARSAADPVRVALTLRDDFLMIAEKHPQLRPQLARGLQLLGTPSKLDLRRILTEPARRAGYRFEDDSVVAEMVDDVAELPSALPLLSFTAAKLWGLRDRHFKQLPTKAYRSLGGVVGALAQHAEDTLAEMSAAERKLVREAFRHLVTAEGTRASLTRDELREVLGGGDQAEPVIEKLVSARILVASEAERGDVMIEVVHEALLSAWPRLVEWRREDAEGARLRDQLRAASRQWDERGRPAGLLWRGDALTELAIWRSRFAGELPAIDAEFADSSAREARRGRRIRQALLAVAFVALAVGIVILFRANRAAEKSAAEAQRGIIALMQEQGRQAHLDGRPLDALLYLNRAYQLGADGDGLQYMIARAVSARDRELRTIASPGNGMVWDVAFSPGGSLLAAADGSGAVLLIDGTSGELVRTLPVGNALQVSFSADGRRLLSHNWGDSVTVSDVATGAVVNRVETVEPQWAALSPDGRQLLVSDASGVVVRNLADGNTLWSRPPGPPVIRAEFSPSGAKVALADVTGVVEVRTADGEVIGSAKGHEAPILAVDWSADGSRIATGSVDKTVRIWSDKAVPLRSIRQRGITVAVTFSPQGDRVVTGGRFETGAIYDTSTGEEVATLRGHTGYVNLGRFTASGDEVVTASADGTVRLWDARRGVLLSTFAGHTKFVWGVAIHPSGRHVASGSWDKTVRYWDLQSRQQIAFVGSSGLAQYHADSERILVADGATAAIHDASDGTLLHSLGPYDTPIGAIALDAIHAYIATGKAVHKILVSTGKAVASRPTAAPIVALAVGLGSLLAARDVGKDVRLFGPDLSEIARTEIGSDEIAPPEFSPDGSLLAVGHGRVSLLRTTDLSVVAVMKQNVPEDEVVETTSLSFSADGQRIAVGYSGPKARVFNIDGSLAAEIATGSAAYMARFSPDGSLIATVAQDGETAVWNASTGALHRRLDGHFGGALDVSFSQDSKLILSASTDKTARLWDGEQFRLLDVFSAFNGLVSRGWFSRDRKRVVLSGEDGVGVFRIDSDIGDRATVEQFVRCRIGQQLTTDGIVPRPQRPADCTTD